MGATDNPAPGSAGMDGLGAPLLVAGTNVLAIQGLNLNAGDLNAAAFTGSNTLTVNIAGEEGKGGVTRTKTKTSWKKKAARSSSAATPCSSFSTPTGPWSVTAAMSSST